MNNWNELIDRIDTNNYLIDLDNGIIAPEDIGIELEELEEDMRALIEELE